MSRELRAELEALQARRRHFEQGAEATDLAGPMRSELAALQARRRALEVSRFQRSQPPPPEPGRPRPGLIRSAIEHLNAFGGGLMLANLGSAMQAVDGTAMFPALACTALWVVAFVYAGTRPIPR
jgi:hypothetical protein